MSACLQSLIKHGRWQTQSRKLELDNSFKHFLPVLFDKTGCVAASGLAGLLLLLVVYVFKSSPCDSLAAEAK